LISSSLPSSGNGDFHVYIMDFYDIVNSSFYEAIEDLKESKGGLIYFVDNFSEESNLYVSPTILDVVLHKENYYLEELFDEIAIGSDCEGCPDWMLEIWDEDYNPNAESIAASYVVPAIPLAAADGPVPIVDAVIALALAAAVTYDVLKITYVTYIAYNSTLNQHYCGRTRGFGDPEDDILWNRLKKHHAIDILHFNVWVDEFAQGYPVGYWAIRGREQQLIDSYGGAILDPLRRPGATSINLIRGVSRENPCGYFYHTLSSGVWGELYPYTGYNLGDYGDAISKIRKFFSW